MKTLTIIIPVLNEEPIIYSSLKKLETILQNHFNNISVIICDGGSKDQSLSIIKNFCEQNNAFNFYSNNLSNPSIIKTILIAKDHIDSLYSLILPIDCEIDQSLINNLLSHLESNHKTRYGGFFKKYNPSNRLFNLYAFIQNIFNISLLKNLVWTNGIFIKTILIQDPYLFAPIGFLEDVNLSNQLKKQYGKDVKILKDKVLISSRKYQKNAPLQILINLTIVIFYKLGFKDVVKLKKLYRLLS